MPLRDAMLATLVAVIWGVNFVVIDEGLEGTPPFLFLALRFTVVLLPAVFIVKRPAAGWRDVVLVGLFMSLGQFGLVYTALHLGMPPGLASLVLQAQVIFTVVLAAAWLAERPTRRQLAGITLGVVGLIVVGLGRSSATPADALVLMIAGALSWATGNVVVRRAGAASGLSMTVWSALVVPIPLFALSLLVDGPDTVGHALTHLSWPAVASTAYTAYLASLVGYGIWNTLVARYSSATVVSYTLLVPVAGMTAAWLAQGEQPNAAEALGGVVLLVGVAVTALRVRTVGGRDRREPRAGPSLPS